MTQRVLAIASVFFCAFLAGLGQLFFKLGAIASQNAKLVDYAFNVRSWLGVSCYFLAGVLYLLAIREANLSTIYPIIATSYIWVSLFAVYFLNEPFSVSKGFGVGLILLGLSLVLTQ